MANVFDYLKWRGDLSFDASPFCEIDALILSELAYIPLDDVLGAKQSMTVSDAAAVFFEKHDIETTALGAIVPAEIIKMFYEMAKSARFGALMLSDYVSVTDVSREEQFSAITVWTGKRNAVVSYRGTDDSVVGWEENFNMAFMMPVPAQLDAAKYLCDASAHARKINVCGHSKGGNLAVFAAANCPDSVSRRVDAVYNFDGPGFDAKFFETDGYVKIKPRVNTFVPRDSIVGMLLEHGSDYNIVESTERGIMQHDGLSWKLEGTRFERAADRSEFSYMFDKAFSSWLSTLSEDERREMIEAIFGILYSTESYTLTELSERRSGVARALISLAPEKRRFLTEKLMSLVSGNAGTIIGNMIKPRIEAIKEEFIAVKEKIKKEKQ